MCSSFDLFVFVCVCVCACVRVCVRACVRERERESQVFFCFLIRGEMSRCVMCSEVLTDVIILRLVLFIGLPVASYIRDDINLHSNRTFVRGGKSSTFIS